MSQDSLPSVAYLVYECDSGGQYLHTASVFELKEDAEKFCEEKKKKHYLEDLTYSMCPVYFAPEDRWARDEMKFLAIVRRNTELQNKIWKMQVTIEDLQHNLADAVDGEGV